MFTVDFSATQSEDGKTLTITDLSIYTAPDDLANMVSRGVVITLYDGSLLGGPNPISFPIVAGNGDTLDIPLSQDYAARIQVTNVPVSAQTGSVYSVRKDFALLNYSKSKLYDREIRLITPGVVSCDESYADVNYSILRWIDDSAQRLKNSDQLGSQRYIDKIGAISLNDCVC